jgi:hypothetical protein
VAWPVGGRSSALRVRLVPVHPFWAMPTSLTAWTMGVVATTDGLWRKKHPMLVYDHPILGLFWTMTIAYLVARPRTHSSSPYVVEDYVAS